MTMTGATKSSPGALDCALVREGYRFKAYRDSGGKWTAGIGFTRIEENGIERDVREGDTISRADAIAWLSEKWAEHERLIPRHITRPLAQYQFDTLADMAYQFGPAFLISGDNGTTGLREAINSGAAERIDAEIARWHFVKGRRDPGVYTRALSRVCQWHALPWRWLYEQSTPDTIKKDAAGRVIETPFMKLNTDGTVRELVTPETALARARAFAAADAARAKAPPPQRVPAETAPSPKKPELRVKLPPGVKEEAPAPPPPPAPPKPARRPVISIGDPYKVPVTNSPRVEDLPIPGIDPNAPPKPMTEAQRFWGLFWIGAGNILQAMAMRGFYIGILPGWAGILLVDALRDPFVLGLLTAATAAIATALAAAPAVIRAGLRKLRKGDAEARQLTY